MKTIFAFIFCLIAFYGQTQDQSDVSDLYKRKLFAELEVQNNDRSHPNYYFYKAVYAYACNKNELVIDYLDSLERNEIPDELAYDYSVLKFQNYDMLFDYQNAKKSILECCAMFTTQLTNSQRNALLSVSRDFELIEKVAPLEVAIPDNTKIPITRDTYGLSNIDLTILDTKHNFLFDTGTSRSMIAESIAKSEGFEFLDGSSSFGGQGGTYAAKVAVASKIEINGIILKNVVFNVVPDDLFQITKKYSIKGIIGLEVAKELGTLVIQNDTITILASKDTIETEEKNLFMSGNISIVSLNYKNQVLPFFFDTGSASTTLTHNFYNAYGNGLSGRSLKKLFTRIGGKGRYSVVKVKNIELYLGNSPLTFSKKYIHKTPYLPWKNLYGMLGQDIINVHKKVVISFDANYLKMEL